MIDDQNISGNIASMDRAEVLKDDSTWFIGDMHFFHHNIIGYEDRPFKDIYEMNKTIIDNWNSVVKKNDRVFVLGDVALKPREMGREYYAKELSLIMAILNGRKILIKGNHDHENAEYYRNLGFENVSDYPIIVCGFLILSHEPIYLEKRTAYRNIHGHIHSKKYDSGHFVNVSVEIINYKPISLGEIRKILGED